MNRMDAQKRSTGTRSLMVGAALLSMGALGAAAVATDFWEGWTSTEETSEDGRTHLTVTDPKGVIQFEEVIDEGTGVLMTDEFEFIVIEPSEDDELIDSVLEEARKD